MSNWEHIHTATRNQLRKEFKRLGYKISFNTNPLCDRLADCKIATDGKPDQVVINSANNVWSREHYDQHSDAFTLYSWYRNKTWLADTDQKF